MAKILVRLTGLVSPRGVPSYHIGGQRAMNKGLSTHVRWGPGEVVQALRDGTLEPRVMLPKKNFEWVAHPYIPTLPENKHFTGYRISRHWRGPHQPHAMLTLEQALDLWQAQMWMYISQGGI